MNPRLDSLYSVGDSPDVPGAADPPGNPQIVPADSRRQAESGLVTYKAGFCVLSSPWLLWESTTIKVSLTRRSRGADATQCHRS